MKTSKIDYWFRFAKPILLSTIFLGICLSGILVIIREYLLVLVPVIVLAGGLLGYSINHSDPTFGRLKTFGYSILYSVIGFVIGIFSWGGKIIQVIAEEPSILVLVPLYAFIFTFFYREIQYRHHLGKSFV